MHFDHFSTKKYTANHWKLKFWTFFWLIVKRLDQKVLEMLQEDHFKFELRAKLTFAVNHIHSVSGDSPREGNQQISKTSELQGLYTLQWPLDSLPEIQTPVTSDLQPAPEIQPTICSTKSASASSFYSAKKDLKLGVHEHLYPLNNLCTYLVDMYPL